MTEKRRFQFGLRKSLIWTAVVALYLGFVTSLGIPPVAIGFITSWAVVVGILRQAIGPMVAASLSVIGGGIVFAFGEDWGAFHWPGPFWGCLAGWFVFVLLETAFRAIEYADNFIEEKTARRD